MFPLYIFTFSRKILVAATVSVAAVFLASLFLYQVHAQSLATQFSTHGVVSASPGKAYLSAQAAAAASSASSEETPMLEVHIANNGLVLLRGVRVLSISGNTIRVGMAWDSSTFMWILFTNYNTQFLTPKGEKETLADIQTGDILTVTGTLTGGGAEPTIDAKFVRE